MLAVQGFNLTGIGAYVKPDAGRYVIMRGTSPVPSYGLWLGGIRVGPASSTGLGCCRSKRIYL
jgi:hypothetical protein